MRINYIRWFWVFIIIFIENLLLFEDYWFNGVGFARDFAVTYHAMPYHWILRATQFDFTQWVPTVAMGYPIQMDPQSALFYPFHWLFVLFKMPYSLAAAVKLQLVHIFLGSLGIYALIRTLKMDFRIALFCALCFQMLGGFQHASHDPDIVRGYALYPWLLFSLLYSGNRLTVILIIPLIFYLFATGVYPGNVIALFFTSSFFLLLYVALVSEGDFRFKATSLLFKGFLSILGLAMASAWLLPIVLNKSELSRMNVDMVLMKRHFFKIENFFTLVFNANTPALDQSQDITMRSLFVGCGVLFPIAFLNLKDFKKFIPWIFIIVFAWFLGSGSYFYLFMGRIFSPLLFSRFLTSDYLPAIVVPFIVLSAYGIEHLSMVPIDRKRTIFSFLLVVGFFFLGKSIMGVKLDGDTPTILGVASLAILTLVLFVLYLKNSIFVKKFPYLLAALLFSNGLSYFRAVESNHRFWRVDNYDSWYIDKTKFDTKVFSSGLLDLTKNNRAERPARIFNSDDEFFWSGWLTGDFSMIDYGITLRRTMEILTGENQEIRDFMMEPSSGYLIKKSNYSNFTELMNADRSLCGTFKYLNYGLDEVKISFSLKQGCIFFHNELFFPGWSADLVMSNGEKIVIPSFGAAGGLLRSYSLPEGEYTLTEKFSIPGFSLGVLISAFSFVLWCILGFWSWFISKNRYQYANSFNSH